MAHMVSKETDDLSAVRNQVAELREITQQIAESHNNVNTDDISNGISPRLKTLRDMFSKTEDLSDAEHFFVVVRTAYSHIQTYIEPELHMMHHTELSELSVIIKTINAHNARATLRKVDDYLKDSELALDGGIKRSVYADSVVSAINNAVSDLINTEAHLAGVSGAIDRMDSPKNRMKA